MIDRWARDVLGENPRSSGTTLPAKAPAEDEAIARTNTVTFRMSALAHMGVLFRPRAESSPVFSGPSIGQCDHCGALTSRVHSALVWSLKPAASSV
jgi:hypothetical protein